MGSNTKIIRSVIFCQNKRTYPTYRIERTYGDIESRKKYSHVDLIHMIGGVDMERGTVTSGGRGYYLMGPAVCLQQALIQLAMQVSNSILTTLNFTIFPQVYLISFHFYGS